jgi:hypothetical protein
MAQTNDYVVSYPYWHDAKSCHGMNPYILEEDEMFPSGLEHWDDEEVVEYFDVSINNVQCTSRD